MFDDTVIKSGVWPNIEHAAEFGRLYLKDGASAQIPAINVSAAIAA